MKVTVFTPTYNRAYRIENAYNSLKRQTCKDFEWLVVDDGSTDNTEDLFCAWVQEKNDFPIRYIKTENGGKMRAANLGAIEAKGELFLNLDSDDYLTDNAIELVIFWESTIKDQKDRFAGVAGKKCYYDGTDIGSSFEGEFLDASVLDNEKNRISGDKAEVFYTEVLRKHPFMVAPGEKFIPEGITWMEICCYENKILRWFNSPLIKCEYLSDGYSANSLKLLLENPQGALLSTKKNIELSNPSFVKKLKLWHRYYITARFNRISDLEVKSNLGLSVFELATLKLVHIGTILRNRIRNHNG